jgi:hypothetical protein
MILLSPLLRVGIASTMPLSSLFTICFLYVSSCCNESFVRTNTHFAACSLFQCPVSSGWQLNCLRMSMFNIKWTFLSFPHPLFQLLLRLNHLIFSQGLLYFLWNEMFCIGTLTKRIWYIEWCHNLFNAPPIYFMRLWLYYSIFHCL